MARLVERQAQAHAVMGQIKFMLAKAKATDGYHLTYRVAEDADPTFSAEAVFAADVQRLFTLVEALANAPLNRFDSGRWPDDIARNTPRARGKAIMGDQIVCAKCGTKDLFIEAPRTTDYFYFQCTACGTMGSSFTETGASR